MKTQIFFFAIFALAACQPSRPTSVVPPAPRSEPAAQPQTTSPPTPTYAVVPLPENLVPGSGAFALSRSTRILVTEPASSEIMQVADYLAQRLHAATGGTFKPERTDAPEKGTIRFVSDPRFGNEGYHLIVTADSIDLRAKGGQGLFYAVQTLRQLMPLELETEGRAQGPSWSVPAVEIEDSPRFRYRGLHLDTARHFFPPAFIKRYVDEMAMYKFNTFHWHLTDDQGWRIEIKKYPKLTEVGGWRKETLVGHDREQPHKFDGVRHGGYYTQQDIKDIVQYAKDRFVTIIPEIEMPGHARAALAAYPELACTKGPFEVAAEWGIFEDIFCPTAKTFGFLEDVLTEVLKLFPSQYIHIGGDEVRKVRWKESQEAQRVIKREKLRNEEELQSYFVRRMTNFLGKKGRRVIGWDEILEGGLAPEATVMSWRGFEGGIEAAKQGHDVIMTPEDYVYLDHYQDNDTQAESLAIGGYTPLEKVYEFEPVPPSFSSEQAQHVAGAQGNVWTEYMTTPERVEYMVFPRLLALSEVLWSPRAARNWDRFAERLPHELERLRTLGVAHGRHFFKVKPKIEANAEGRCVVGLHTNTPESIHYTLDGSEPTPRSPLYQNAIVLDRTTTVRAVAAKDGQPLSPPIAATCHVSLASGKPTRYGSAFSEKYASERERTLTNGLKGSTNFGDGQWLGFAGQDLDATLDLGKSMPIRKVSVGFLRDAGVWIMLPGTVEFMLADDGKNFRSVAILKNDVEERDPKPLVKDFSAKLDNQTARYVRVRAKNYGKLPAWHPGAGNPAWLFTDELIVE